MYPTHSFASDTQLQRVLWRCPHHPHLLQQRQHHAQVLVWLLSHCYTHTPDDTMDADSLLFLIWSVIAHTVTNTAATVNPTPGTTAGRRRQSSPTRHVIIFSFSFSVCIDSISRVICASICLCIAMSAAASAAPLPTHHRTEAAGIIWYGFNVDVCYTLYESKVRLQLITGILTAGQMTIQEIHPTPGPPPRVCTDLLTGRKSPTSFLMLDELVLLKYIPS